MKKLLLVFYLVLFGTIYSARACEGKNPGDSCSYRDWMGQINNGKCETGFGSSLVCAG